MGRDVCISGCWELHSVRFLVFPRIEYLHPLGNWFLCSVTLTIFIYFCLNGISCLSTCAHWLFCHCILLRVWLCLLMSSHQIFAHIVWISLRLLHAHLSPNAPVPSTLLWPISGYALVCPCLLCTGKPRPRHSAPGMPYWDLVDGKNHCPEPADDTLQSIGY